MTSPFPMDADYCAAAPAPVPTPKSVSFLCGIMHVDLEPSSMACVSATAEGYCLFFTFDELTEIAHRIEAYRAAHPDFFPPAARREVTTPNLPTAGETVPGDAVMKANS